jgi:hypothetical protein
MHRRAMSVLGCALLLGAGCPTEPPPDTCEEGVTKTLTIGSPTTGEVAEGDCELPNADGRHGDSYNFTVDATSIFNYNVQGSTETGIRIRQGDVEIAEHENGVLNFNGYVALKPGTYTLDIASDDGATGTYSIGSGFPTPPNPQGCASQGPDHMRFAQVGVTFGGEIKSTDCTGGQPQYKVDNFNVRMIAGTARKITVTVSAAATVELRRIGNPALVTTPKFVNAAGNIVVDFTPGATDYFNIAIIATPGTGTITYTLKVE